MSKNKRKRQVNIVKNNKSKTDGHTRVYSQDFSRFVDFEFDEFVRDESDIEEAKKDYCAFFVQRTKETLNDRSTSDAWKERVLSRQLISYSIAINENYVPTDLKAVISDERYVEIYLTIAKVTGMMEDAGLRVISGADDIKWLIG